MTRRLLVFLVFVLGVAGTAYALTYYYGSSRRPENEWAWMQREFHLSAAQLARIEQLQAAYKPTCVAGCARIMAAQKHMTHLERNGHRDSPAYLDAVKLWRESRRSCNEACYQHMLKVAAVMNPADGKRYLAMMTPRIRTPAPRRMMGVR